MSINRMTHRTCALFKFNKAMTLVLVAFLIACQGESPSAEKTSTEIEEDNFAPVWGELAELRAILAPSKTVELRWSPARDEGIVIAYELSVKRNSEFTPLGRVEGGQGAMITRWLPLEGDQFQVIAIDRKGNRSSPLETVWESPSVDAISAPMQWPTTARVLISSIGEESAVLSWPPLETHAEIEYQVISSRGLLLGKTSASSLTLEHLEPMTRYQVWIDARDELGRYPPAPLQAEWVTLDLTPPSWPENAELSVVQDTQNLVISWPQAQDRGGLDRYELSLDGELITQISPATLSWSELISGRDLQTFQLVAIDRSGLRSETLSGALTVQRELLPTWPPNAQLIFEDVEETTVSVRWPMAMGDVGRYQLQWGSGEAEPVQLSVDQPRAYSLSALPPLASLIVSITPLTTTGRAGPSLSRAIQLPDLSSPSWPIGAEISLSERGETSVVFEWTRAEDPSGIARYHVILDGETYTHRQGATRWVRIDGLRAWTDHAVEVIAEDPIGNQSHERLYLSFKTNDIQPPWWPQEGELTLSPSSPSTLNLSWPAALDEVGVARYQIQREGEVIREIEATPDHPAYSVEIGDLTPWAEYTFSVIALDEAGRKSVRLTSTLQMPDPSPPIWRPDSALNLVSLTSTTALICWDSALDDARVASYEILVDGELWRTVTVEDNARAQEEWVSELVGLRPGATHLIELFALDLAGNRSVPLLLSMTTPDGADPEWPSEAALNLEAGMTEVRLSWPVASDDVGVVTYEVHRGASLLLETRSTDSVVSVLIEDLSPETLHHFSIYAIDASGKSSEPLSGSVETGRAFDPGFRRLSREQLLRSLADLHGYAWRRGCEHPAYGETGCSYPRTSEYFYEVFTERNWGDWLQFRRSYPRDELVSPDASPRGGYLRFDQLVFPEHLSAWVSGVKYITNDYESWIGADIIVRRPCEWEQQQGITAYTNTVALHRGCLLQWINDFAPRAMRRPITEEERQDFLAIYDEVQAEYASEGLSQNQLFARALSAMMFTINLQPEFIYHVEIGDEEGQLTAYELSNRLSYHFWNTMPDEQLFEAAADGSLLTETGLQAQVDRLFADSKALRSIEGFYHDYFRVNRLPDITAQDGPGGWANNNYHTGPNQEEGTFPHYGNTGGANGNIVAAMSREMINLGAWFTFHEPDSYREMFSSNLHFLQCSPYVWDPEVCSGAGPWSMYVYKINGNCSDIDDCNAQRWIDTQTGWDGVSPPITLPETERAGLVTRMAMLSHDTLAARPIRRGLNIREILLCDPVPPPENCDVVKPPAVEGRCITPEGLLGSTCKWDQDCQQGEVCDGADSPVSMTVREKVEALTEQPGTSCAGCHSTFINGFGHALNHFSSLGQYWEEEHMFTNQRNGNGDFWWFTSSPDRWRTIDASGTTLYQNQWVSMDGAHDLRDFLLSTGRLEWCWSREYFRYSLGRLEWEDEADLIEALAQSLREGNGLDEAFKAIVFTEPFQSLYKPPTIEPVEGGVP